MTDLAAFIAGLPKAELHMHVEGSLEPELMFLLARRNRVDIGFHSVEEVRAACRFSNLQDFLDIYYRVAAVLRSEDDFPDLAAAHFDGRQRTMSAVRRFSSIRKPIPIEAFASRR